MKRDSILLQLLPVMGMVTPILWRGRVRHHLVVGDVVLGYLVDIQRRCVRRAENGWRRSSEITGQGDYGDVHDVVAKPAAIRPSTRNYSISKTRLNLALKYITAKDAEPMETGIIRIAG